jgi:shikimate kinase
MNIILIGYRGSGKSTVGRRLAARMRRRFVDTDDLIESEEGRISDIVKSHGWDYFRAVEKRIIDGISKEDNLVIALGGGAVLDPDNIVNLERNGLIIYLKADQQTLLKRMDDDPGTNTRRPTLTGKGTLEEIEEIISVREPFYEKASDIQIDTSTFDIEAVIERVLAIFDEKLRIG